MNASRLSENALRKKLQNLEQKHRVIKLELLRRAVPTVAQFLKRAQNKYNSNMTLKYPFSFTRKNTIDIIDELNPPPSYRNDLVRLLAQYVIDQLQRGIDAMESMGVQTHYTRKAIQRGRASIRNLQQ